MRMMSLILTSVTSTGLQLLIDTANSYITSHGLRTVPDRGGRISSYGLVSAAVIVECHGSCK